jgi:hypothetical protein
VDGANHTAILDTVGNILHGALEALSKENETMIPKILWLSDRDNGMVYGSMAVYVTEARI